MTATLAAAETRREFSEVGTPLLQLSEETAHEPTLAGYIESGEGILAEVQAAGYGLRREPLRTPRLPPEVRTGYPDLSPVRLAASSQTGFRLRPYRLAGDARESVPLPDDLRALVADGKTPVLCALADRPKKPVRMQIAAIDDEVILASDLARLEAVHAGTLIYRAAEMAYFLAPGMTTQEFTAYHEAKKRLLLGELGTFVANFHAASLQGWDGVGWRGRREIQAQDALLEILIRCGVVQRDTPRHLTPGATNLDSYRIVPASARERFVTKQLGV